MTRRACVGGQPRGRLARVCRDARTQLPLQLLRRLRAANASARQGAIRRRSATRVKRACSWDATAEAAGGGGGGGTAEPSAALATDGILERGRIGRSLRAPPETR